MDALHIKLYTLSQTFLRIFVFQIFKIFQEIASKEKTFLINLIIIIIIVHCLSAKIENHENINKKTLHKQKEHTSVHWKKSEDHYHVYLKKRIIKEKSDRWKRCLALYIIINEAPSLLISWGIKHLSRLWIWSSFLELRKEEKEVAHKAALLHIQQKYKHVSENLPDVRMRTVRADTTMNQF